MQTVDVRYRDYFRALMAFNHQTRADRSRTRDAYFRLCRWDSPRPEVRRRLALYALRDAQWSGRVRRPGGPRDAA